VPIHAPIVDAQRARDKRNRPVYLLTLFTPDYHVMIWIPIRQACKLEHVRNARWVDRRSIRLGTSAGKPVFWSCEKRKITLLIGGNDDEAWDIALVMPVTCLSGILRAIEECPSDEYDYDAG
jgi:hypothetical protein